MTDELRQQVREEMLAQHITQVELGKRAGISTQYVWDVLSGKSSQLPSSWRKILDALGLELVVRRKG